MFVLLRYVSGVTINDAVQVRKPKPSLKHPHFPSISSRFVPVFLPDFWPCSLDSWRQDAENGRKMGKIQRRGVQVRKPKYRDYILTTSAFFPWCRKHPPPDAPRSPS